MKHIVLLALTLLLLSACGQKLEGTYSAEAEGKRVSFTFESGGKLHAVVAGEKAEAKYELNGDKVKIVNSHGDIHFLTLHKDGSLEGPDGIRLTKK